MSNITINFLPEPETSFTLMGLFLFFLCSITLYVITWYIHKKINIRKNKNDRYLNSTAFNISTAIFVVSMLISITLKENIFHEYTISQKYFSIDEKGMFFTTEAYPHGQRNINDEMQSVLFVTAMKAKFITQVKEPSDPNCEIVFIMGQVEKKITMNNTTEFFCTSLAEEIKTTVNYHRLNRKNGKKQFDAVAIRFEKI